MEITYIKTGFGAPVLMDALLSLGISNCKRILFVSSIGALDRKMGIGDIVIPEYAISGDGASRYIASECLKDVFGEKNSPDFSLYKQLLIETDHICHFNQINWHQGKTFCTDTILAQYAHLDDILALGCNTVDMETAVAFRAARMMNKPLAALSCISDNSYVNQSLMTEISQSEQEHRQFVRQEIIPKIIMNLLKHTKTNSE